MRAENCGVGREISPAGSWSSAIPKAATHPAHASLPLRDNDRSGTTGGASSCSRVWVEGPPSPRSPRPRAEVRASTTRRPAQGFKGLSARAAGARQGRAVGERARAEICRGLHAARVLAGTEFARRTDEGSVRRNDCRCACVFAKSRSARSAWACASGMRARRHHTDPIWSGSRRVAVSRRARRGSTWGPQVSGRCDSSEGRTPATATPVPVGRDAVVVILITLKMGP